MEQDLINAYNSMLPSDQVVVASLIMQLWAKDQAINAERSIARRIAEELMELKKG